MGEEHVLYGVLLIDEGGWIVFKAESCLTVLCLLILSSSTFPALLSPPHLSFFLCINADPYVVHHSSLGSYATIYLEDQVLNIAILLHMPEHLLPLTCLYLFAACVASTFYLVHFEYLYASIHALKERTHPLNLPRGLLDAI